MPDVTIPRTGYAGQQIDEKYHDVGGGEWAKGVYVAGAPTRTPRVGNAPGLAVSLPSANTDPGGIAVPSGATSVVLWFATSSTDPTPTSGRVAFGASATALAGITGTDTVLGYQAPLAYEYAIPSDVTYLHVACALAGAVCRGQWLS